MQGFLTAVKQEVNRKHAADKWALDDVVMITEVCLQTHYAPILYAACTVWPADCLPAVASWVPLLAFNMVICLRQSCCTWPRPLDEAREAMCCTVAYAWLATQGTPAQVRL